MLIIYMFELRYPHYANWYDLEALPHDGRKLSIKNSFFSRRGPRRCRRRCLTSPITEEKNRYPRGTCVGYLIHISKHEPMTIVWDTTGIPRKKHHTKRYQDKAKIVRVKRGSDNSYLVLFAQRKQVAD